MIYFEANLMKTDRVVFLSNVAYRHPDSSLVNKKEFFKLKDPKTNISTKISTPIFVKITILALYYRICEKNQIE